MKIERTRYVIMSKNRTEILCGNRKNRTLIPITNIGSHYISTWCSKAQAQNVAVTNWGDVENQYYEVVPVIETIEVKENET